MHALAAAAPEASAHAAEAVKTIVGLVVLVVLAYLAGHPRAQAWERRLGLSQMITTGLPFVFFGALAHLPAIDVLPDRVLAHLRPILPLGLGWIGFALGFRFDARAFDGADRSTSRAVTLIALVPFGAIVAAAAILLVATLGLGADAAFFRNAVLLGAAGIVTTHVAETSRRSSAAIGADTTVAIGTTPAGRAVQIAQLQDLVAMLLLVLVAAFFRPGRDDVAWRLPGVAWVFVTLGLATAMGTVAYALLAGRRGGHEILVTILGVVCFSAGLAGYLRLSPLVVCFVAGVLLANFPGEWKDHIRATIVLLERPIYLLFLVIAGALWRFQDWQGWALMALFVIARLVAKSTAVALFRARHPDVLSADGARALALPPVGMLAVAIAVNAQDLYFGRETSWLVTAVIGGAMVTEIVVQLAARRTAGGAPPAPREPAGEAR